MAKGDEPRDKPRGTWKQAGSNGSAATTFAGNIMAMVAMAVLFDEDDDDGAKPSDEP